MINNQVFPFFILLTILFLSVFLLVRKGSPPKLKERLNQDSNINQIVLLGFGAVQKALCTLILKKEPLLFKNRDILIIEPLNLDQSEIYQRLMETTRVKQLQLLLTRDNYKAVFEQNIYKALVIDLAFRIDTADIVRECENCESLYINTAIDIWPEKQKLKYQSIYDVKQHIKRSNPRSKTAILNFGANPGLISHFVKMSLTQLAIESGDGKQVQYIQEGKYNLVAQKQNLTLIQISERDTQIPRDQSLNDKQCEIVNSQIVQSTPCQMINTWSVIGFLDEAFDNAQISFGTHDRLIHSETPVNTQKETQLISIHGNSNTGLDNPSIQQYLAQSGQIVFTRKGVQLRTRSFEPVNGHFNGYNIPHAECYSLVDFLRVGESYRPGSHYSYLPSPRCIDMLEYSGKLDRFTLSMHLDDKVKKQVLRNDQIESGFDSLGALMYFRVDIKGKPFIKTLWSGTILNKEQTASLGPEVNATTIQVAISMLSAIMWMIQPQNQQKGILEPEYLPSDYVFDYCRDYLGTVLINRDCTTDFGVESDQYLDLLVKEQ